MTQYTLPPGRFYPGTPHNYAVYIPAQYDSRKPAPFMIFLDGSGFLRDSVRAPIVLDNLIAKHDLPPMVAIFVDPGVLPALSPEDQNRYERIFEYDSLSDRYSRFLLQELIPEVAKKVNLSTDPNDHAICGVSTGAVGAFMAAWNRPDQFHRVLSFIGTYVAMKGADELPALIRKTEPKPLRVFLQDGVNDHIVPAEPFGTFYAGSWPINNQVMYQALEYSGYDAKLVMGEEAHNMKQGAAILPDALRWLWRGYPVPIVVHEPAAMHQPGWDSRAKVFSTVWLDRPWTQVEGNYVSVGGLAAGNSGDLFFADPAANRIYRADAAGNVTIFQEHTYGARALCFGADGRLYVSQPARKRIVSYGPKGEEREVARGVVADGIAMTAKGDLYFVDQGHRTIGLIHLNAGPTNADPKRPMRIVYQGQEIALPSSATLSPDQSMLVAADSQSRFSWSFQIAADGSLINGEPFYRLAMPQEGWMSGTNAVMEDSTGQVYFATPLGIQICEQNGRMAEILNPPDRDKISSIAFAGKDLNWLYAAEGNKLFRRPVKVTGNAVGSPVKPPKPSL